MYAYNLMSEDASPNGPAQSAVRRPPSESPLRRRELEGGRRRAKRELNSRFHLHNSLIQENIAVLRQGLELLYRLDDDAYPNVRHPFSKYGIGSHFRHSLDFYTSFLKGVEAGRIDYDDRQREERIETDRLTAISRFEATVNRLRELSQLDNQMPLLVRLEDAGDEEDPSAWSYSSVRRELQSLVSHTVHHYALIAVMLQLNGFEPVAEFGVAPSTLKQWRATASCAQ